jgi:sulfur-oxidizing protein SoxX
MKTKKVLISLCIAAGFLGFVKDSSAGKIEFEHPDAKNIMLKDIPPGPRMYAVPENCKLDDPKFIAKKAPEGKKIFNDKKTANCVACHCAPGSVGCGNIGPDLDKYRSTLMTAPYVGGQVKTIDWLFQRIADYRVQIPEEYKDHPFFNIMTVNLTTGKLTYDQVCALTAFLLSLE